jgi:dienelactone hydrolase
MQLKLACKECGKRMTFPVTSAGKPSQCPGCRVRVDVPRVVKAIPILPGPSMTNPLFNAQTTRPQSNLGPFDAGSNEAISYQPVSDYSRTRARGGNGGVVRVLVMLFAALVGLGFVGFVVIAGIAMMGANSLASMSPSTVPVPTFPELGIERFVPRSNISYYTVDLRSHFAEAGGAMQFRVYMPIGQHATGSLPCVLLAPAGSNLLHGSLLSDDPYDDEALPYAKAGMVVVQYSLDGEMNVEPGTTDDQTYVFNLSRAYKKFVDAKAGVVNGRNAVELVLQRIPQVDPKQLYSAGHSSAATVSLLLAAHEPRLAGSIAYAPITDLKLRLEDLTSDRSVSRLFPGLLTYLKSGSPIHCIAKYQKPLFIFHARDDSNEPFAHTEKFVNALANANAKVTFVPVSTGDHYQSMIDQGIPKAIDWIKSNPQ